MRLVGDLAGRTWTVRPHDPANHQSRADGPAPRRRGDPDAGRGPRRVHPPGPAAPHQPRHRPVRTGHRALRVAAGVGVPGLRRTVQVAAREQCRDGWHLEDEPVAPPAPPDDWQAWLLEKRAEFQQLRDQAAATGQDPAELDELLAELDRDLAATGIRGKPDPGTQRPHPPPPVHPTPPGRPRPAPPPDRPAHHRPGLHRPERQDLPALDVPDPHLRLLRQGRRRRHPGRPGPLRLPARRAGCDPLPGAVRPVHQEPAPLPRLRRPVLRRHRTPATPRPARPHGHARHRVPRRPAPGPRRHLPPGLVAIHRRRALRRRPAPGLARGHPGTTSTRPPAKSCPPGTRPSTPSARRTAPCTWPGSGPSSTPTAYWPGRRTPSGASGT